MKKICVVTGSRAEYGLMSRLMKHIRDDGDFELQVIATNMHLSPEYGLTYKEIEADGFTIDRKVEMLLSSDSANGTVKSVGLATIGFADAYEALRPDLLIILGDRYEMLAASSAALLYKIPIAHISGGDVTEGAYDDAIRHSITKMSHLHFPATECYRNRVIQLGENPERVFNVGSLGIDNIRHLPLMDKKSLEESLQFAINGRTVLVTFHSETLGEASPLEQFNALLSAFEDYPDIRIIFTKPNSDTNGKELINRIDEYCLDHKDNTVAFTSLGHLRYLSALQYVAMVVGNSSSGIVEVPCFGIPTINIGDRQKGRLKPESVIDCRGDKESLCSAIDKGFSENFRRNISGLENLYEQPGTAKKIIEILKRYNDFSLLLKKSFYDLK